MPIGIYKRSEEHKKKIKEWMKYPKSEDTKRKIKETLKRLGIKPSQNRNWLGKHHSQKSKDKMSFVNKNKPHFNQRGEKHWNWKGGVSPKQKRIRRSIEFRLWREVVFARDNWTCQKYRIKGVKLHPHHIQNFAQFPELRFAIDNGITLSEKAHKEFHAKYGRRNNTKEQLEEFLK